MYSPLQSSSPRGLARSLLLSPFTTHVFVRGGSPSDARAPPSPPHLPASAVPDDGVLMSAGSAAPVVAGERERGRERWLGRVLKPIACPAGQTQRLCALPRCWHRRSEGSEGCAPRRELSVFLSAQIRLPLCTFPCERQFLTANISQKPEPALSLPPFFPPLSLSSVYEAEGKCLISCLIAWVIGRHTQLSK